MERGQVVDGGEIGRGQPVACTGGVEGALHPARGLPGQIVDGDHALHDPGQVAGNARVQGVGVALPAVHQEPLDGRAEGALDPFHVAGEDDAETSPRHVVDAEAGALEPVGDPGHVLGSRGEGGGEFLGVEPAVVAGGRRILLVPEKLVQGAAGLGGHAQGEDHAVHGLGVVGGAQGEVAADGGGGVAWEGYPVVNY